MTDTAAVATAYIDAVGAGRWDEVAALLTPDATFEIAGGGRHEGATAFLAAFDALKPIIERNEIRSVITDGDRAVVLYDFVTRTPVGGVLSAEWLTIEDGKVASSYLLFDKGRWPEVMQHLQRPVAPPSA
ncbi:MAG: nuclear transport factor 2 family protein [Candidatus Dormibacteraeota bacterium]|nr:nuclear transport factor 2 family protein [Candidatus Dormibacteraeota bacterium]